MQRLPPSLEEAEREAAEWEQTPPEDRRVAWYEPRHGRGALLGLAVVSLVSFWFAPWVIISSPYDAVRSGQSLASGPLGFLWGGAVAWGVVAALVLSRRTPRQMRGVRAITMALAAMTSTEIGLLMFNSPQSSRGVPFVYEWGWGLWLSLACSVAGVAFGWRFGGRPIVEPEQRPAGHMPSRSSTLH